jgi:hypothetical protein
LPAAKSIYPPQADSNGNSGVPAAAPRAQDRRFFPGIMHIEQTIEVPADHRLLLELPAGISLGMAKIALHITPPDPQKPKRAAFQSLWCKNSPNFA